MKRLAILITLFSLLFPTSPGFTQPLTSTLKDQQDVAITIYNSNVGLVKDTRLIDLKTGVLELKFMDVAAKIDPTTVHIKSLVNGSGLNVLEQNYEYDLLSPQKLLEKFVGQRIQLATIQPGDEKGGDRRRDPPLHPGREYLSNWRQDPYRSSWTGSPFKNPGEPHPKSHTWSGYWTIGFQNLRRWRLPTSPPGSTGRPTMWLC